MPAEAALYAFMSASYANFNPSHADGLFECLIRQFRYRAFDWNMSFLASIFAAMPQAARSGHVAIMAMMALIRLVICAISTR